MQVLLNKYYIDEFYQAFHRAACDVEYATRSGQWTSASWMAL